MPTYALTSPTTLLVTFSAEEAAIIARAQREGVASFTQAVDSVLARFRDKYDAEDKSELVNRFGSAPLATKKAVFDLLRGA